MISRRIVIIGLIVILAITLVKLGNSLLDEDRASVDDEIEIISSEKPEIEIVEDEGMRKQSSILRIRMDTWYQL